MSRTVWLQRRLTGALHIETLDINWTNTAPTFSKETE
ncbi:hypothetical protein Thivi_0254 [Thiocystis violascens DSM 198]|uniref:Uncharacterized protein n=1 Tax=Thiocystis violascens (strain ATCC 17096 / DSM 198 / 6111) TaxID=765911 RepID=I3Y5Q5_THIV6|nr:hypothetical protein Thivi_0254 [Thiocystis violascens DSM 198]